ncbi:MAG: hypothetical protein AAB552_01815 [Patescibacteria group bacterium]
MSKKSIAGVIALVAGFSFIASAMAATITFTTSLKQGSTGMDVKNLQMVLNMSSDTQVSTVGAGSPGNETSTFGPATKKAVMKFQEKYASEILAPVGLTSGTGFVGPSTRSKLNMVAAGGVSTGSTSTIPGCTSTAGFSPTTGQSCAGAVVTQPPAAGTTTTCTTVGSVTTCTTTSGTSVSGGLTVSAPAQPGNGLAVESAARVPFTKVTLTAGASDVTVNGITVERTGAASDSVFSGVVLVDEDGTQLDIAKTFGSTHQATVGGTFTVKAGTSKTLTIGGNIAADLSSYAGQVASISVVSVNTSGTVSGALPISGAMHTANSTLTIGTAVGSTSSYDPGTTASKAIGTTGYKFTGVRVTAGSAEDVRLKATRFYQAGSAGSGDLSNVKIYVDGTAYDTTVSADGKYYSANFGSGIVIAKGLGKDIWIAGDITGSGSAARTVDFDIQKNTDVYVVGETYGYGIIGSGTITTSTPSLNGYALTINAGSVTSVNKALSVGAQNVAVNVANQVLGGYEVDLKGEPISVQSHVFTIASTTGSGTGLLTSVSLYNVNGAIVAGPVDAVFVDATTQTVTFTDTVTYPIGKSIYTLKGKVASAIGNGGTYIVKTTPSSQWTSVTGQTTGNTISLSSLSTQVVMNTMTVRGAALGVSVSTQPPAQTVITGSQGFTFANVLLDASQSGEDVRFSSIPLAMTFATMVVSEATSCQLFDGTTALNTGSNVVNPSGASDADTTFTFDQSLVVTKGTVKTLALKCNVASSVSADDTLSWGINAAPTIAVTGVTSGNDVTETVTASAGQTMTVAATGSYTVTSDAALLYKAVQAGTTGVELAKLRFTAGSSENISLKQIALELGNTSSSSPADLSGQTVTLWNGATQIGTAQFGVGASPDNATSTQLSPAPTITAGESVMITVKGDLTAHNAVEGTPGAFLSVTYDGNNVGVNGNYALGVSSQANISSGTTSDVTTTGMRIFRTVPTVAVTSTGGTGTLQAGADLYKFTVTNPNTRDVVFQKFSFSIATSSSAVNAFTLYGDGVAFNTTAVTVNSTEGAVLEIPASGTSNAQVIAANSTKTYILKAATVPNGSTTVIDSITLALLADTSYPSLSGNVGTVTTVEAGSADTDNIVWSPFSTTTPVATAATQSNLDWTNGYGLPGFPSNTAFPTQTWTSAN